jgi:hypothetical protein
MLFSRTRVPGKHLTCVIGGSRVSIFLFAAGDSGSDRLGRGDGRGLDGRGCGGGSGYGRLSHGWAGGVAPFAVTADNAGGDGERQRQEEEEAELHFSLVVRLLFPKWLGRGGKEPAFDGCPRRKVLQFLEQQLGIARELKEVIDHEGKVYLIP